MHTSNILQILNYSNPSNLYEIDESKTSVFKKNHKLGVIKITSNEIDHLNNKKNYTNFVPKKISLIYEILPKYFDPKFYIEFENERKKYLKTEIFEIPNLTLIKSISLIPKEIIGDNKIIFEDIKNNFQKFFKKNFLYTEENSLIKIKVNEEDMILEEPIFGKFYPIWNLGVKFSPESEAEEIESIYFTIKSGNKDETGYSILKFNDLKKLSEKIDKHKLKIIIINNNKENYETELNSEFFEKNSIKNLRKNYWNLYEEIVNGKICFTIFYNNNEYKFISKNGEKIIGENNLIKINYEMIN